MKQDIAGGARRRHPGIVVGSDVLDSYQAAEFLGAHVETVRRMARRAEVPCYKVGRDWRFTEDALRHWRETHHARQRKPAVLVVDDERSIRETFAEFLQIGGYRVTTVESAPVALEALRDELPDVILLDLVMPGMSGIELLEALHSMGTDIPVIIVAAHFDERLSARTLRFSPLTVLRKPVRGPDLVRAVDLIVHGSVSLGADADFGERHRINRDLPTVPAGSSARDRAVSRRDRRSQK